MPTTFLRLLHIPIDAKGDALAAQIAALNASAASGPPLLRREGLGEGFFLVDPTAFAQIPGSPFAYWVPQHIAALFSQLESFANGERVATKGLATTDDFQFLRTWWEVQPAKAFWVPFAKGGSLSPFFAEVSLVINWKDEGQALKDYIDIKLSGQKGTRQWSRWINATEFYFRSGLTWPLRASKFSPSALPTGCIFSVRGYAAFLPSDQLLSSLAIFNSSGFDYIFKACLGRSGFPEFVVGVLQQLPWPLATAEQVYLLSELAKEAHDLARNRSTGNETSHVFCLPDLVIHRHVVTLREINLALDADEQARQTRLAEIEVKIDDLVSDLYMLDEADRVLMKREVRERETQEIRGGKDRADEEGDDDVDGETMPEDLTQRVQNLLMWCVGVAFGRWDVRMALDPFLLPALQGPFGPLPRCAPGALIGVDGLPPARANDIAPESWLRARENVLDFRFSIDDLRLAEGQSSLTTPQSSIVNQESSIAWDGILVDDPTHPSDIVTRVRQVLRLLWGERADAIELEAAMILGFSDLRAYFRDPRQGFFAFHIKRYSKSRRKAPIYWLLQSEKRNYAIWLYCHRLHKHSLYVAGRDYADAKVRFEETRLQELRQSLDALAGSAKRQREREIERQEKLVAEVTAFRNTLDQIALRNLPPDLNDGVLISVAPLHPLMPWKEAERMWEALVKGEYAWSMMAQQMKGFSIFDLRLTISDSGANRQSSIVNRQW